MPSITHAQIRHIAKLARLRISDEEGEKYTKELSSILAYIAMLKGVNTDGVEPTAQIVGLSGILRDDAVCAPDTAPGALLATSPLPIRARQIETSAAHG